MRTRTVFAVFLLCAASIFGADAITRLKYNLKYHNTFYLNKKNLKNYPPCLTQQGRFKINNSGDLFSKAMDAWGVTILSAKSPDKVLKLLDAMEKWCKAKEQKCRKMTEALEKIYQDLSKGAKALKSTRLAGEFDYFVRQAAAGDKEPLQGILQRLIDMDRWLLLNFKWIRTHATLIKQHKDIFTRGWLTLGTQETFLGTSLIQRLYDIAEIQLMFEDMMQLTSDERSLYIKYRNEPASLGAEARAFYSELKKYISSQSISKLDRLLEQEYEISFVNVHFTWYFFSEKGFLFCARKLADSINNLEKNNQQVSMKNIAEIISYRQGEIYCGYRADSRFHKELSAIFDYEKEADILDAGTQAVKCMYTFYKQSMRYGASQDIAEAFDKRTADCFRMSNLVGAGLANGGFAGIYPMRTGRHSFIGLRKGENIICCDPLAGIPPLREFPGTYLEMGDKPVEIYTRTLGGWVTQRALIMPEGKVVEIKIPY